MGTYGGREIPILPPLNKVGAVIIPALYATDSLTLRRFIFVGDEILILII